MIASSSQFKPVRFFVIGSDAEHIQCLFVIGGIAACAFVGGIAACLSVVGGIAAFLLDFSGVVAWVLILLIFMSIVSVSALFFLLGVSCGIAAIWRVSASAVGRTSSMESRPKFFVADMCSTRNAFGSGRR